MECDIDHSNLIVIKKQLVKYILPQFNTKSNYVYLFIYVYTFIISHILSYNWICC